MNFTDVFINIGPTPWFNFQVGQFDAPFTLENRTSDKYFDFMERSLAVRAFAVPNNKEDGIMLWGYLPAFVKEHHTTHTWPFDGTWFPGLPAGYYRALHFLW